MAKRITNVGKISITPRGDWNNLTADYEYLDLVQYLGSSFLVKLKVGYVPVGFLPTNTTYFTKIVNKGDTGSQGIQGQQGPPDVLATVTAVNSPTPTRVGQIGRDANGRYWVATALTGSILWEFLVKQSDSSVMFMPYYAGATIPSIKSSLNTITIDGTASVYLINKISFEISATLTDFVFTFSSNNKIMCLDTSQPYTVNGVYRKYTANSTNIVEKTASELIDQKFLPLAGYYGGFISGFSIGDFIYKQNIKEFNNLFFSPMGGGLNNLIYNSNRSLTFTGAVHLFGKANERIIQLYATTFPITFTFSETVSQVLVFHKNRLFTKGVPDIDYDRYYLDTTLGSDYDNAVTIVNQLDFNSDNHVALLYCYQGKIVSGAGLMGADYINRKIGTGSQSAYRLNTDKVISTAQPYTKNAVNGDNYMFIQINDIHTNLTAGRLSSYIEAMKFAEEASTLLPIKFGLSNGDLTDGLTSTKSAYQLEVDSYKNTYNTAPLLWLNTVGNHDDNSFTNKFAEVYTKADQRTNFIDPITTKFPSAGIVKGSGNACYYYFDDPTFKIRNIVLDPIDLPYVADGTALKYRGIFQFAFSNTQLNWLASTALDFSSKPTPTQWTVNVFCHVPIRNTGLGEFMHPTNIVPRIMNAFKTGGAIAEVYTDTTYGGDFSYSVTQNYTTLNGGTNDFVGYFSGHRHEDFLNTDPEFSDQKNIIVNNAWVLRDYQPGSNLNSKVNRAIGTVTENSFDLMIIDKNAKKVRAIRFGAGLEATSAPVVIFERTFTY